MSNKGISKTRRVNFDKKLLKEKISQSKHHEQTCLQKIKVLKTRKYRTEEPILEEKPDIVSPVSQKLATKEPLKILNLYRNVKPVDEFDAGVISIEYVPKRKAFLETCTQEQASLDFHDSGGANPPKSSQKSTSKTLGRKKAQNLINKANKNWLLLQKKSNRPPITQESEILVDQPVKNAEGVISDVYKSQAITTKFVALDCEMVGVGSTGKESALAKVSIVDYDGKVLLDKLVKPKEMVVDYRTAITGIRSGDLDSGSSLEDIQKEVYSLIKDKIVVGHHVSQDFKALLLEHPRKLLRDTSRYKPFRRITRGKTPALRTLAAQLLNIDIQSGHHSSIEDARVAMLLYRCYRSEWERRIKKNPTTKSKDSRMPK